MKQIIINILKCLKVRSFVKLTGVVALFLAVGIMEDGPKTSLECVNSNMSVEEDSIEKNLNSISLWCLKQIISSFFD